MAGLDIYYRPVSKPEGGDLKFHRRWGQASTPAIPTQAGKVLIVPCRDLSNLEKTREGAVDAPWGNNVRTASRSDAGARARGRLSRLGLPFPRFDKRVALDMTECSGFTSCDSSEFSTRMFDNRLRDATAQQARHQSSSKVAVSTIKLKAF